MRQAARTLALSAVGELVARAPRLLERPRVHHLYFHSLPPGSEAGLRALLSTLAERSRLVSYSEAVAASAAGNPEAPVVSLSVDDAFGSCMRIAEVADEFGLSVCFFVPSGLVGAANKAEVAAFFRTDRHIEDRALTWYEIEQLRERGHEIGSHTVSHPDLGTCSDDELRFELEESKRELERHVGPIDHFAWPYGTLARRAPSLETMATRAGYRSVASAIRGSHRSPVDLSSSFLRREHCDPAWPVQHNLAFLFAASCVPQ